MGDAIILEAIKAAVPGRAFISPHKGLEARVDIDAGTIPVICSRSTKGVLSVTLLAAPW
jgi:hypothetical protein